MSELIRLKQDEQIQELMDLVEMLQKESEDKDRVIMEKDRIIAEQEEVLAEQGKVIEEQTGLIAEQKMQLQECLELNEKLNRENRNASAQALQSELKKANDLLEEQRLKVFGLERTREVLQDKLNASEEAREYAETHQRIEKVTVKENVLYEKCRKCHKGIYDTALVGFVAYSLLVTIFAAVKSKVFVNDLGAFFVRAWNVIRWFVLWLVGGAKWAAQVAEGIQNEALADVLYWLIVVVSVSVVIGGIGFGVYIGVRKVREIYLECCWDRVSVMEVTISLAIAVHFGEEIRAVVPVNLVVMMLVVHGAYIGVRKYVKGWKEARGYR